MAEDFKTSELDPVDDLALDDEIAIIRPTGGGAYTDARSTMEKIVELIGANIPANVLGVTTNQTVSGVPFINVSGLDELSNVTINVSSIVPQTDNVDAHILVSTDNGVTYLATNEYSYVLDRSTHSVPDIDGGAAQAACVVAEALGSSTGEYCALVIKILGQANAAVYKGLIVDGTQYDSGGVHRKTDTRATIETVAAITDLKLVLTSGNINAHVEVGAAT